VAAKQNKIDSILHHTSYIQHSIHYFPSRLQSYIPPAAFETVSSNMKKESIIFKRKNLVFLLVVLGSLPLLTQHLYVYHLADAGETDVKQASSPYEVIRPETESDANRDSSTLNCHNTQDEGPEYCAPWEVDSDNWWLHHPDWEPSTENETAYCFAPIKDTEKATFLKELHDFQWTGNCSEVEKSCEVNSGFGASTGWLQDSFWHASKQSKPFQILLNGRPRWLYSTANNASWAYCENKDTRCYYLPVSPCSRDFVGNRNQHLTGPRPSRHQDKLRFHWMRHYLYRPKQHLRRKSFEMRQSLNISYPCTTMHVRRGDVGAGFQPFRRFAAVQEYLDEAQAQEGDNIVLLTDAESTIQEAKMYHPNYNWIYLDRPRHESIVKFNNHLPSGDESAELLAIEVELRIASTCQKVVYGDSGFVKNLLNTMTLDSKNFTSYHVYTRISMEEAKQFNYSAFVTNIANGSARLPHP
jgi:hypothetical protein